MKKYLLFVTTILVFQTIFAQIPSGYYDSATGTGYTLKTQLYNIIKGHTERTYADLWNDFYYTDRKDNGYVWDVYSDVPGGSPSYDYTFYTEQCGTYGAEGDCYNREHSFPKSWFAEGTPMYTDLFHLYPTDGYVNGKRSNYPFGEVGSASWTSTNGSKLGTCSYTGYSGTVFEPIDEYKGDFARTYFYMATRYENVIAGWETNDSNGDAVLNGTSDQVYEDWFLNMIIEWHNNDPVSQKEINRNDSIYQIQGNRNPFIDHPEYVANIWQGVVLNTPPTITNVSNSPETPTSSDPITISATITDSDGTITNAEIHWGLSLGTLSTTISMTISSGETYEGITSIPAQTDGTTVYFEIVATDDSSDVTTTSEYSFAVSDNPEISILDEDFSTCPASGWIAYSNAGTENWECGTQYMQINAYGSDVACDDWLISPAQNLNSYENEILTFQSWTKYTDSFYPPVELKYSTDYSGSGDPASATWNDISATVAVENSETWTSSGNIDISAINGSSVYFAFHYTSSGTGSGTSAYWEIDDVLITGTESTNVAPEISGVSNSPQFPTEGEDVTISATITDSDGTISSANIKWGTTTGNYPNTVSMTNSSDVYSGVIPSQAGGTNVFYVIEATDDDTESSRSDENSFSFNTAGNTIPEINNLDFTPTVPENDEKVTISAIITDSDGTINSAQIKWGTTSGNYPNTVNMFHSGDEYVDTIPEQNEGTHVYFIVYAIDEDGGSAQSAEQDYIVNTKPKIANIGNTPTVPESTESTTVTATITDIDGTIVSALVKWGTFSGSYTNSETMTNTGDSYSGVIPAQDDKITVFFIVYAEDDNGAITESSEQTYTVDDPNALPKITGILIDPSDPESTENVRISATIEDSDGKINSATLKWGTSTGNYSSNISMTNESGDSYLCTIPAQTDGTEVFFIIEAEDDEGGITTSSEESYLVEDPSSEAPVISDVSYEPANPTQNDDVVVSCAAEDTDGSIVSVLLKWKEGTSGYTDVSMNLSGGNYYGQIPRQSVGTTVDFKIIAEDNDGLQGDYNGSYVVSESSGVIDFSENSIRVFPNPANEFINIRIDNYNQQLELNIYDIIGSQIYKNTIDFNDQYKLSLDNLESGIYFISFVFDNNLITKKIVIEK